MEDASRYIPILKWKPGEQAAVGDLAPKVKRTILPLLEVVGPSVRTGGGSSKTIQEHLNHAASQMAKCWGTSAPLLLDASLLPAGSLVAGKGALPYVLEQAHARSVRAVPVVSTHYSVADLRAVSGLAGSAGVALRETIGAVVKPSFQGGLLKTLKTLGVEPGQVDLVIDVGEVGEDDREVLAIGIETGLKRLPASSEWRSLTLAAASFPVNLAGMRPGIHALPRTDWSLWTSLSGIPRQPNYGDYGIAHPDLPKLNMTVVRPSASIRYTTSDSTLVVRGRSVRDPRSGGFAQYHALSQTLMAHPAYAGATFSWGDTFIERCASGGKPGSLTTWRQVGTNHHLTLVVKQLAKRSGT